MNALIENFRRELKENDAIRDYGLKEPEVIISYKDILYGEDPLWQRLDVYRPKLKTGELPVIVSVHGGAWIYGDKELYRFYCMELAKRGFAVINFTYRLTPEYKFPAPIEDTNYVFCWMVENALKYKLNLNRVYAVGDSAGAHTLGIYMNICTNTKYAKNYNIQTPKYLKIQAIALNCGKYMIPDFSKMDKITAAIMKEYLQDRTNVDDLNLLNIAKYVTSNFPPTFLMTSIGDFLVNEPQIMVTKFWKEKVPFVYQKYGDEDNKLMHDFHCDIKSEAAKICNHQECDFFEKYK